jgi:hypothetical protein
LGDAARTKVSKEGRSLPRASIALHALDRRAAGEGYGNDDTTIQEWVLVRLQHLRDARTDGLRDTLSQVAVANGQAEGHPALLAVASRSGISGISSVLATGARVSLGTGER